MPGDMKLRNNLFSICQPKNYNLNKISQGVSLAYNDWIGFDYVKV